MRAGVELPASPALMDDTALGDVQTGELRVRIAELHVERSLRRRPALADFAGVIFKAVRQVDPRAMLFPGHRIADRVPPRTRSHPDAPRPPAPRAAQLCA